MVNFHRIAQFICFYRKVIVKILLLFCNQISLSCTTKNDRCKSSLQNIPFKDYGESLKFGANFLYYWTYRTKNDLQTEYTSVTCLLPNKTKLS